MTSQMYVDSERTRAKIGLIVAADNTTIEPEFNKMVPVDVSILSSRTTGYDYRKNNLVDALRRMYLEAEDASKKLALAGVDVVVFGCTSGSFLEGSSWNEEITRRIARGAKAKPLTATTAVVQALRTMKATKIGLVTPYAKELNIKLKKFLESQGFRVTRMDSIYYHLSNMDIYQKSLWVKILLEFDEVAYSLAKGVNGNDLDTIFISCTGFRTINVLEKIEKDFNKSVISSNQATLWASLRLAGISDKIKGFGRLLEEF